jgi:catechol 2,3-dioxygenase-like lactoylglutathione lyase family enzyme
MPNLTPAAFHHTCFVVRDLEATAEKIAATFHIGPFAIWTIAPQICRVNGEEQPFSFRVALATVGGATFEIIAPHTGNAIYEGQLAANGDGFSHTCFSYASLEDLRAAKADLLAQGRRIVQEGSTEGVFEFAYFEIPEVGSLIEVLYLDPSQLPAPEAVIPSVAA